MPPRDPNKASLAVRIDASLLARARRVARDLAGRPLYLSLSSLTEAALREHVERYEALLAEGTDDIQASSVIDRGRTARPSRNHSRL